MDEFIINTSLIISYMSLVVIAYGSIIGILGFFKNEFSRFNKNYSLKNLNTVKINFGYYLLLGLDFMIAADVVRTIKDNTLQDLTILGISVVIRTLLAYFLGREISDDEELRVKIDDVQKRENII